MTTGRINQVTLVKRNKNRKPLKKEDSFSFFFFFTTTQSKRRSRSGSEEVLYGLIDT